MFLEKEWCAITFFALYVFLAGAALTDLLFGKVYNKWLFLGAVFGIGCTGITFLEAAAVVLIFTFWLFRLRMMGAGDCKMMAVIAGYLGVETGIRAIGAGLAVGAVWSLCRLWHDRNFRVRLKYFAAYFMQIFNEKKIIAYDELSGRDGRHRIPLAACLAAGVFLYLVCSGMARSGGRII